MNAGTRDCPPFRFGKEGLSQEFLHGYPKSFRLGLSQGFPIDADRAGIGHLVSPGFGSCPRPGSGAKLGSVDDYVRRSRLNPELVERIRQLVIERYRR